MRKGKIGLQKEISRIFTGIQIPKKEGTGGIGNPVAPPSAHPAPPQAPAPHTNPPESHTAAPVPPKTAVPSPVQQSPVVHTNSAAAALSAQHTAPKSITSTPHLFTIPEPPVGTSPKPQPSTESSVKLPVYEKPAAIDNVYEPPAINKNDNVYEPPPSAPQSSVGNIKIQQAPKKQWLNIVLKIVNDLKNKLPLPKSGVNQTRQKIMIVLIPVLSLVFIIVLIKVFRAPSVQPPIAASGKTAAGTSATGDGKITWEIPAIYPENLRDPMVLGAVSSQTGENAGKPSVKGIVYSEDHPIAVVGDRIVSAGEVVQGITVVKINPDSVEFSKGDQKWTQEVER
jgi:hypothetical protein